jgi:hypothetical protein
MEPLVLDEHDPALLLLQRIRDEAHRFAVTFHRKARSMRDLRSELDGIPASGRGGVERCSRSSAAFPVFAGPHSRSWSMSWARTPRGPSSTTSRKRAGNHVDVRTADAAEPRTPNPEPRVPNPEPRVPSPEPEPRVPSPEPRAPSQFSGTRPPASTTMVARVVRELSTLSGTHTHPYGLRLN